MGSDQEIDDLISVEEAGLPFKDLKIILQPCDTSFGKMSNISTQTCCLGPSATDFKILLNLDDY